MTVDRGMDTPPPTGTDDDIAPRIRAAVDAGELRGVTGGPVERLGAGESYTAWRIGSGEQARVLRLPRLPPHDLPRPMETEYEVLRRVPPELGTSAVALEFSSDNPLGTPYMVTTHVPGRALRATDWNPRLATALAHQIARLHEALATTPVPAPSTVFVPSAGEQGEKLATWWGEHHPQALTDPRVRALLPTWRRELDRLAPAFEAVPTHRLIHGDAVAPNVILGPDGLPRLIDFEWSGPGDTAKDLALIGGRVTGGPWYLPMTPTTSPPSSLSTRGTRGARGSRRTPVPPTRNGCWSAATPTSSSTAWATSCTASAAPARPATADGPTSSPAA